jgi:hypothetical protein
MTNQNQPTVYDVVPHEGIGPVRLGMSRAEAREAMERAGVPLPPVHLEDSRDEYHNAGFQVSHDASGNVEYIEIYRGEPFVTRYRGVDVFTTPADEMVALVAETAPYDPDDADLGLTYVFRALDLSLWRPVAPEDCEEEDEPDEYDCGRVFTTIGVGRRGYYGS